MSQENVEIVRRVNAAFDESDIEGLLAEHHPNVEIVVLRSEIEGPYHGHDGLRRMAADVFAADFEVRVDEIRDCGSRVLVLGHQACDRAGRSLGPRTRRGLRDPCRGRSSGCKRSRPRSKPSKP